MSFFCFALAVLFIACACLRSVKTDVFLLLPTMIVLAVILVILTNTFCRKSNPKLEFGGGVVNPEPGDTYRSSKFIITGRSALLCRP